MAQIYFDEINQRFEVPLGDLTEHRPPGGGGSTTTPGDCADGSSTAGFSRLPCHDSPGR